jgi:hypothetical protein
MANNRRLLRDRGVDRSIDDHLQPVVGGFDKILSRFATMKVVIYSHARNALRSVLDTDGASRIPVA